MDKFLCATFFILAVLANTKIVAAESANENAVEFRTAAAFQKALKTNDRKTAADLIKYPIEREYPLPPIKSPSDFTSNWDDFFDTSNIPAIIADKPARVGWRGVMLGRGDIWFDGDRIIGINVRTKTFQKKFADAKNRDFLTLNPIARGYKGVEVTCSTPTKNIRVQEHADGYHYFAWKKGAELLEKPELVLKGTLEFEGSGGNRSYTFKNRDYSYVVYAPAICESPDYCNDTVTVSKDGKELSTQICK